MIRSIRLGAIPEPVTAPPDVALELVTNGYVPWSTSNIVAWPPSNNTVSPRFSACAKGGMGSAPGAQGGRPGPDGFFVPVHPPPFAGGYFCRTDPALGCPPG